METKIAETITIIRPSNDNNVLNEEKYDITRFVSKQGKEVAYFEEKQKETNHA